MMVDFSILSELRPATRPNKNTINLIGHKFGRLTPLGLLGFRNSGGQWLCRCDCGNFITVIVSKLLNGNTRSCKCLQYESQKLTSRTHNTTNTRTYKIWAGMKARILNPKEPSYKNYGGRGLDIYKPWLQFENFLKDMGHPPSPDLSLERIDNNRGYYPDNCEWATRMKQMSNTRHNRYLTIGNETYHISEWARRQNMKYGETIISRLRRGHSPEEAVGLIPLKDKRITNGRRRKTPPVIV